MQPFKLAWRIKLTSADMGAVPNVWQSWVTACRSITGPLAQHVLYISWKGSAYTLQWRHNGVMAFQITSIAIVYSTVYSGADQRKHQISASLASVRRIHRTDEFHAVTWKMFPFEDVIMTFLIILSGVMEALANIVPKHGTCLASPRRIRRNPNKVTQQLKCWIYASNELLRINPLSFEWWSLSTRNHTLGTRSYVLGIFEQKLKAGEHMLHHRSYS